MLFWRRIPGNVGPEAQARARYLEIARHARQPAFYAAMGVPDSLDGRFEMLCLHAFLLFRNLKGRGDQAKDFSQAVYDAMFENLDAGLRELGASDIGLGRRIKAMTEALNGRIHAYERGLDSGRAELKDAIRRNVFGTVESNSQALEAMAHYVELTDWRLRDFETARLMAGPLAFQNPLPVDTAKGSEN